MIIFGTLPKRVQGIIKKYLLSKKTLDRAEMANKKCRDDMIKEICQNKGITSETIFMGESDVIEITIKGAPRSDTSWTGAWKEFDMLFSQLIESDPHLLGEYLRARRTAEINNKKSPYMRWEIRLKNDKDGGGDGA